MNTTPDDPSSREERLNQILADYLQTVETGETPDEAAADAWQPYRRWTSWIPVMTSASSLWIGIMVLAVVAFVARLRKRLQRRRQWDEEDLDAWRASRRLGPASDETRTPGDSTPTIH